MPRVTIKSLIFRFAMISPFSKPTNVPAIVPNKTHCKSGQPLVKANPKVTAPKVMVELTDRSMPAVKTVKVWPTAIIAGIEAATKILFRFQSVRNSAGAMAPKNAITNTKATTTSQSDQKNGS